MIAFVPAPSALSKTICARQTCFCDAFRVFDQIAKPIKVGGRDGKRNTRSHAADSHAAKSAGNPSRDSNVRFHPLAGTTEAPGGTTYAQNQRTLDSREYAT